MSDRPAPGCDLAGIGVLVTRPRHQADALCEQIAAQGGSAIAFPALEITAPTDPAPAQALLHDIARFHLVIFISPNAVQRGLALLPGGRLPAGPRVAAVGQGTARALAGAGIEAALVPQGAHDSETLLALPELRQVRGKSVLIVRGEGGRALLGDTLRQRGAAVHYAEVYRRQRPQADVAALLQRWPSDIQIVTTTSNDILDNLATLLGEAGLALLRCTPLVVISERMVERAHALGCRDIILAQGADNRSVLDALCRWARESGDGARCFR